MLRGATFAVGLIALSGSASAQNTLVNPGFESGELDPWFALFGDPTPTMLEAHTGDWSVAAFGGDSIRQDFAAVPTENITEVSVWVKRTSGPFNQYTFYYDDGTDESFVFVGDGDDWEFFDMTANLEPGKNLNGFSIFGTTSGPAYMDDFVIVPAPGAVALLAIGGLGAARRRR